MIKRIINNWAKHLNFKGIHMRKEDIFDGTNWLFLNKKLILKKFLPFSCCSNTFLFLFVFFTQTGLVLFNLSLINKKSPSCFFSAFSVVCRGNKSTNDCNQWKSKQWIFMSTNNCYIYTELKKHIFKSLNNMEILSFSKNFRFSVIGIFNTRLHTMSS